MNCISTSKIVVLVNGSQITYFHLSWGIRQGDPMSPNIFILCKELLSTYINYQVDLDLWDPIKIRSYSTRIISHLWNKPMKKLSILSNTIYPFFAHTLDRKSTPLSPKSFSQTNAHPSSKITQLVCSTLTPPYTLAST